jgi:hypothetical protein
MMLSCLLRNPLYVSYLKRFCESAGEEEDGPVRVPSVARLQSAIEDAWKMGFDLQVHFDEIPFLRRKSHLYTSSNFRAVNSWVEN